jgi:hypothetical protein
MSSLPLRYWCHACGQMLFRSAEDGETLIEAVCHNRRCPERGPRVVRVPEDAREQPCRPMRFRHGVAVA